MFRLQVTAMTHNEILSKIGERIRTIRLEKKLTIREVAESTSLTKGLLSKVENSKTVPSLPVFVEILKALDVSIQDFFKSHPDSQQEAYFLFRKNEYRLAAADGMKDVDHRYIFERIIPTSSMEIFLLRMKAGAGRKHSSTKQGHNFEHIISGTCEYRFKDEIIVLNEGDSIYFTTLPENVAATKNGNAVVLVINFHPLKGDFSSQPFSINGELKPRR